VDLNGTARFTCYNPVAQFNFQLAEVLRISFWTTVFLEQFGASLMNLLHDGVFIGLHRILGMNCGT